MYDTYLLTYLLSRNDALYNSIFTLLTTLLRSMCYQGQFWHPYRSRDWKSWGNECQAVWMTEVPQRFQGWSPDEDLKHGKLYLGCLGNQCYYVQFIQICKLLYRVVVYVL